ncbi:MAG TPA: hypothetical protein VNF51_02035 [Candidatus Paceibacterota bacterium]|nr:hypothetical protein [Candidatus Paceibacterota bacterium]
MDLPPTIPTSFVPQTASVSARRFRSDFSGAFALFAYGVLGLVFLLALGVFAYDQILANQQGSKDAALSKAEAAIDPTTATDFVRLRDRLNSATTLLTNHVAFSGFFTLLETILPTTVRFTTLHLSFDSAGNASFDGSGIARSFNALAATSAAFAADGRIKDAIFSNIVINKDNSVSFSISASLDPKLIAFSP